MNGGGPTTVPVVINADADRDSVSSDSGRGPSEEEFRANSVHSQQLPPTARLHNGTRIHRTSVMGLYSLLRDVA